MADNNKLWFEMGVRDEISSVIKKQYGLAQSLQEIFDTLSDEIKSNSSQLETVFSQLDQAITRVRQGLKRGGGNQSGLKQLLTQLLSMRDAFKALNADSDRMAESGAVAAVKISTGFDLAMRQVDGYTRSVENLRNILEDLRRARASAPVGVDVSEIDRAMRRISGTLGYAASHGTEIDASKVEALSRAAQSAMRDATTATNELESANARLAESYDKVVNGGKKANTIIDQVKTQVMSYASLWGLQSLYRGIIEIGGAFEQQHIALRNILGDMQEADKLFNQMKSLAVVSPFNFSQLVKYTKQTAAFNVPAEELYDTTKRLADLSAGLGVDMQRLILAYGQVRSAAVLRGQELRQFTEAGIPMVQALADKFTELKGRVVETGEVFGLIQKRQVPFEMVKEVLWDLTDAGGKFYNMQFVLSDTLLGKWSNLRDAWEIFLSGFAKGESITGSVLKGVVVSLTSILELVNKITPLLAGIVFSKTTAAGFVNFLGKNDISKNLLHAKELVANRLKEESLTRTLSAREREILRTKNEIVVADLRALSASGSLNTLELQKLYVNKRLTKEKVDQLLTENLITAEEHKQILATTRLGVIWAQMKTTLSGIWTSITSLLKSGTFWFTVGLTAASSAFFKWVEVEHEMSRVAEDAGKAFEDSYNAALKTVHEIDELSPKSDKGYTEAINSITKSLKELGAYDNEVRQHAEAIENLEERYKFLKDRMEETAAVLANLSATGKNKAEYIIGRTDGWFDDSIITNSKQASEAKDSYEKAAIGLGRYNEILKESVNILKERISLRAQMLEENDPNNAYIEKYRRFIAALSSTDSASEQIELMKKYNSEIGASYTEFYNIVSGKSLDAAQAVDKFHDAMDNLDVKMRDLIDHVEKDGKDVLEGDVADMIEGIKEVLIMDDPNIDFSNLSSEAKQEIERITKEILSKIGESRQDIKDAIEKEIFARFNIKTEVKMSVSVPDDYYRVQYPVLGKVEEKLWKKGIQLPSSFWWGTGESGNAGGYDELHSYWDKQVKELEQVYKDTLAIEGAESAATKKAKKEWEDVKKARDNAFGAPKSKGKGGGSKKDTVLEAAKTQLDAIKKFYSEYKKYREVYGEERALSIVDALFPSVDGKAVVENYKKVIENLLANAVGKGAEWEKYRNQLSTLLAEIDLDQTKEELSKALKAMERYIQDETSKWNLYKELKGKAGKDFAMLAFTDNVKWDDMTRGMAEQLRAAMEKTGTKGYGLEGFFEMDDEQAKKFFGANEDQLKLWQEIAKTIRKNWVDDLKEIGAATEKLKTTEEKIRDVENEIADLRRQGAGANDPRVIVKQNELKRLGVEAYENSEPYLKFYSSIFAMTAEEAEDAGAAIKENLVRQLADGVINADKYVKSIKNVDAQLQKIRDSRSDAFTLLTGGFGGLLQKRQNVADSAFNAAALSVQFAEEKMIEARKAAYSATTEEEKKAATQRYALAWIELENAKKTLAARQKELFAIVEITKANEDFLVTVDMIAGMIDGMAKAAQQISDMFDALGHEGSANTWSDIADGIGAVSSSISALNGMLKSGMSGDIGGVISNAVGIFTNPITAFAKLHDKKLDRKIQRSQKEVRKLTTEYQNLQKAIENTLGGIYSTGGYDEMFASLQKQRDELQKQYDAESDKKKKDSEKLADYEQQLKEANETINNFALDMAKSLYNIDLQGWAKDLTDAIVNAWENGEDAVEAYRSKVKDIMKDLTKNILAKKVMEKAFESLGIDEIIAGMMDATSGKLDESAIPRLAEALNAAGEMSANVITRTLDNLEAKGYIEKGDGSSGSRNVIHGDFTEQETGLLLSYVNAIRGDVSLNRMTLSQILLAVQGQTEMPVIAQAQLQQLEQISANTMRNAEAAEAIQDILHKATLDKAYGFAVK